MAVDHDRESAEAASAQQCQAFFAVEDIEAGAAVDLAHVRTVVGE
jgi:hypothetical protein